MEKGEILFVFLKSDECDSHELKDMKFLFRIMTGWSIGYGLGLCHFGESNCQDLIKTEPHLKLTENEYQCICKDKDFVGVCSTSELIEICRPSDTSDRGFSDFHDYDNQLWWIQVYGSIGSTFKIEVETRDGHKNKRHLNIDVTIDPLTRFLTVFVKNIKDYHRSITCLNFNKKGSKLFLPIFKTGNYDYFIRPHKDSMGKINYHDCIGYTDDFILEHQEPNDHQYLTQEILNELHKQPNYLGCICVIDVYYQHLFIASPNQGAVHYRMFFGHHHQSNKFDFYLTTIDPIENIQFNFRKILGVDSFHITIEKQ